MHRAYEVDRVNLIIPRRLKTKLAKYAAKNEMTMTAVIKSLIKKHLEEGQDK